MSWVWYLANDMQFFIISPIFIYSFYKYKLLGWGVLVVFFIGAFVAMGVIVGDNKFSTSLIVLSTNQNYFSRYYEAPWARISPYLVGIGTAFAIEHLQKNEDGKHPKFHFTILTAGYVISGFFILSCIYGIYPLYQITATDIPNWPLAENIMYLTFSRAAFVLGIAFPTLAFYVGHGGYVNKLLSLDYWFPFARLTYGAYLLHPTWISIVLFSASTQFQYTDLNFIYFFIGNIIISYSLAFIGWLAFEKPIMNLEKWIFLG